MQMKTVVLYPSLGVGHLNPMVELGKVFLRRGVAVIVAVVDSPDAMGRLATASPDMTFRHLPVPPTGKDKYSHPIMRTTDVLRVANPALRSFLRTLPAVDAVVVDMLCTDALDVAAELGIPAYFSFTSPLGHLAVNLHLPYNFPAVSLRDTPETTLRFPGVPPIRAMDMVTTVQDRESDIARARLRQCARMPEARGFLVNSFDWLEARALEALRCGLCTPGRSTPPVYCIGPLVVPPGNTGGGSWERHPCLEWLDTQPNWSVVLLSFGSMGIFSAPQLREMARGLENSGHRFLWVVRNPPEHRSKSIDPDLEALLPDGFLERTREKGLVVKNWAPQMEVLRHDAVGAFVTHCGWNSALEGIVSGVPMICWPLYSEQRMNKVRMVEKMKVGVAVRGYEKELVEADKVEAKVRLVMESESDEGRKLRERLAMAKKMAADALKEGGSSHMAFDEFLESLNLKKSSSEVKA